MHLDLAAEVIAALRSLSGREALREAIAPTVSDIIKKALEEQREKPETLDKILGITQAAALKRIKRDGELRALGIKSGRRLVFITSAVRAYLSGNGNA